MRTVACYNMTNLLHQLDNIKRKVKDDDLLVHYFVSDTLRYTNEQLEKERDAVISLDPKKKNADDLNYPAEKDKQFWEKFGGTIYEAMSNKKSLTEFYADLSYKLAFIFSTATFDASFGDILRVLFLYNMKALKSNKTLTTEAILDHSSIETLREHILNKELSEISYKSFKDQIQYVNQKFNLDFKNTIVEPIIEIIETRNIHVHNRGFVNNLYLSKVDNSIYYLGDYRVIDEVYLKRSRKQLISFIVDFIDLTINKISK